MKTITTLLICLALCTTASLTGCAEQDGAFTPKSYTADGEQITEVCVVVRDRQIEVTPSPDNQIHIAYFESGKEYYELSVSDEHVLTMTAASDKAWTDYIGAKSAAGSRKISLQLPDKPLTALRLSTTNETISLPALTVSGDLSLTSHGGDLVFDRLNVGNAIHLEAKNGDISGSMLGSYDDYAISCDVKKGESNLPSGKGNGTKTLAVSNNNGDVEIAFVSE